MLRLNGTLGYVVRPIKRQLSIAQTAVVTCLGLGRTRWIRNISRKSSTASTGFTEHGHENGVVLALDCPSLAGPSKRREAT